eukprot:TRINITY_DN28716_c0_g1_i1.p3 TRINITY_DN28716_c0_g1~~TRINITY_DN28716_c0_g1_i1.p3  ORF type:complete len:257 (+),score=52.64 TRINITY_DN28716_c0_g1_i1:109-879(+)
MPQKAALERKVRRLCAEDPEWQARWAERNSGSASPSGASSHMMARALAEIPRRPKNLPPPDALPGGRGAAAGGGGAAGGWRERGGESPRAGPALPPGRCSPPAAGESYGRRSGGAEELGNGEQRKAPPGERNDGGHAGQKGCAQMRVQGPRGAEGGREPQCSGASAGQRPERDLESQTSPAATPRHLVDQQSAVLARLAELRTPQKGPGREDSPAGPGRSPGGAGTGGAAAAAAPQDAPTGLPVDSAEWAQTTRSG